MQDAVAPATRREPRRGRRTGQVSGPSGRVVDAWWARISCIGDCGAAMLSALATTQVEAMRKIYRISGQPERD